MHSFTPIILMITIYVIVGYGDDGWNSVSSAYKLPVADVTKSHNRKYTNWVAMTPAILTLILL